MIKKKKKKLIQINKLTYSKNAKSKKFTTNYYIFIYFDSLKLAGRKVSFKAKISYMYI